MERAFSSEIQKTFTISAVFLVALDFFLYAHGFWQTLGEHSLHGEQTLISKTEWMLLFHFNAFMVLYLGTTMRLDRRLAVYVTYNRILSLIAIFMNIVHMYAIVAMRDELQTNIAVLAAWFPVLSTSLYASDLTGACCGCCGVRGRWKGKWKASRTEDLDQSLHTATEGANLFLAILNETEPDDRERRQVAEALAAAAPPVPDSDFVPMETTRRTVSAPISRTDLGKWDIG